MGQRSGQSMLKDIDRQAHEIRETIGDLNQSITKVQKCINELHHDQAGIYVRLAEMHMDLLDDPDVAVQITLAEKEASMSFKARQQHRINFDQELKDNQSQQDALETKRADLVTSIEDFYNQVKSAERDVEAQLVDEDAYKALLRDIETIKKQVHRVQNKIVLAHQDYDDKSKPYHEDELFIYLQTRSYGTSAYQAKSVFRVLDDWVARLTHYEQARRDYTMLRSIPEKLTQHQVLLEEKIEALQEQLKEYKKAQFKKHGVATLQAAYLKKQTALDDIDKKLEALEQAHLKTLQNKANLELDTDEFYNSAISKLSALYKDKSLNNIRRYVAMTDTEGDDALVQSLYEIEREAQKKHSMLSTYTRSLDQETSRLSELQKVRSTYKEKRYDVRGTKFEDEGTFGVMLGQLLIGVLSNRHFWNGVGDIIADILDEIDFD